MERAIVPLLVTLVCGACLLAGARALFTLRRRHHPDQPQVSEHVVMLALTAVALAAVVISLPVSESLRGQILGLLGLALTGVIALSSTTFVANAMAGLMLRAVGNFRPGDFLRVGDHFGRVTERGLFHTEIQTEDRDLATLPNLYLVTQPVKVVRESGTLISAELSLSYDLPHDRIEALLADAAAEAGLEEPFVHVRDLGDFAVRYRVAGFLRDVKHLVSARSRLLGGVLDTLHGAGIEIVSPTFMNQRQLTPEARFVPAVAQAAAAEPEEPAAEALMFDKADAQAALETLRAERQRLTAEIENLERAVGDAEASARPGLEADLAARRARVEDIDAALRQAETPEQRDREEPA